MVLTEPQPVNNYSQCLYGIMQVSWHERPHWQKEQRVGRAVGQIASGSRKVAFLSGTLGPIITVNALRGEKWVTGFSSRQKQDGFSSKSVC